MKQAASDIFSDFLEKRNRILTVSSRFAILALKKSFPQTGTDKEVDR